ncbi:MAG TPA: serine/threonine protein kinase [Chloroflexi bacterium]|nr:serine/threonine protein kinase [Chloroflexota bacterium]
MSEMVGRNLGPYRILEELGIGGMATVYKAYQPSMDRYVAVKVLPRHFAQDPTFSGRFEHEARVIARLEHARILPVYDYGEEDGITYIVMRYLDAGTLADRIQGTPLDLEETVRIISQIAEGLDYAHSRGVIHRDIKPSNIMLDRSGDVYITDFGIAKLAESTTQFTGSGIVGTPTYLSPEQGLGQPVDHRTDIYSLGVVLYQMLTGDVPFHAETPMAVVIKHIYEPLPLPHLVNPEIPESVERVILKAMAKQPEERFESCGEMAAALQQAVEEARQALPDDEVPTRRSQKTDYLKREKPPSTHPGPLSALADAGTLPISGEVPPPPVAKEEEPAAPPEPAAPRRRWWVPVLIGGALLAVLLLVVFVFVAAFGALSELADKGGEEGAATVTEEAPPTTVGETGSEEPTPLPEETAIPALADLCPTGMQLLYYEDFESEVNEADLPEGSTIEQTEDGEHVLQVTAPQDGTFIDFGEETMDAILVAEVIFPEEPVGLLLANRLGPPLNAYGGIYDPVGRARLVRAGPEGEVTLTEPAEVPDLTPRQVHRFELGVIGSDIKYRIDDLVDIQWQDSEPLPAGRFAVEVRNGVVWFKRIAVCAPERAEGETLFATSFDSPTLDDSWFWLNEPPPELWGLADGRLRINVLPETGLDPETGEAVELPALVVPLPRTMSYTVQTKVLIAPEQNYQGAGLVLLSRAQEPLITLTRAYCDPATPPCEGDAIYFHNFTLLAQRRGGYEPFVAGAGELPDRGTVALRLVIQPGEVQAFYNTGEPEWQPVGVWPFAQLVAGYAGVMTTSGVEATDPLPAFFDSFEIIQEMEPMDTMMATPAP